MPPLPSLELIQHWMQAVITHPDGVAAGMVGADAVSWLEMPVAELDRVVLPSQQMSSVERLQIYQRAYFSRLIECLQSQFPAVRKALGDQAFDGFAFGYVIHHPSTRYTLATFGRSFEEFLQATRPPRGEMADGDAAAPDFADFLIELARLESLYSEVFHSQGQERVSSLRASDFETLSAEDFAACRLLPHACVRLQEFRFPVHEYASAVRSGAEAILPLPRPVRLVITRRDYVVRRFELQPLAFELLSLLLQRLTVGDALQRIFQQSQVDTATFSSDVRTWFRDWSAAPLFTAFERS